jgi:hypothetical protein
MADLIKEMCDIRIENHQIPSLTWKHFWSPSDGLEGDRREGEECFDQRSHKSPELIVSLAEQNTLRGFLKILILFWPPLEARSVNVIISTALGQFSLIR